MPAGYGSKQINSKKSLSVWSNTRGPRTTNNSNIGKRPLGTSKTSLDYTGYKKAMMRPSDALQEQYKATAAKNKKENRPYPWGTGGMNADEAAVYREQRHKKEHKIS